MENGKANKKIRPAEVLILVLMIGMVVALILFIIREKPRMDQVVPSGQGDVRVIDSIFDPRVTILLIETRNPTWQIVAVIDAQGHIGFEKVR